MELRDFIKSHTLALLAGGFIVGVAACGLGSAVMAATGSPEFCGTCHSMKQETWSFAESSHSRLECTDCHLPHDNAVIYMVEKGRTGMVDMYHEVMRDYPAHISLSEDARATVNGNCLRCHEGVMDNVHIAVGERYDTGADCLKCHSRIAHGANRLEGGIKVE